MNRLDAFGNAHAGASSDPSFEHSFDVSDADFQHLVLERSKQTPVLLDIWAPWCAPCRSLKPVLEKLAGEYDGRFALAKLNSDDNPQVAAALRVRSIPQVVLFVDGRAVDQFMGALPESQVRAFLDRHLKVESPAEQLRLQAAQVDGDARETLLRQALALEPGHGGTTLDLARHLLDSGRLDAAQALLDAVPDADRQEAHAQLTARLKLRRDAPAGDADALAARVAADPHDVEARFALAALRAHAGDFPAAFELLLDVVLRDKSEARLARERARAQLVEWFALCPDREAVDRGRRLLGMYLN